MTPPTTIGDLLERDLSRPIEEVIKVYQNDEQTVLTEITEYVATPNILAHYRELFDAIARAPTDHKYDENVGVWVSGFFGSGKSSFAKLLGYALSNRTICGRSASELFIEQLRDPEVARLVRYVNQRVPCEVMMFDISMDLTTGRAGADRVGPIVYRRVLAELGYAEDMEIAELEIELEGEGRLDEFLEVFRELYPGLEWGRVRSGAQKFSRASAVMHRLDPATYPEPTSWATGQAGRSMPITVRDIVNRCYDLMDRRKKGKALVLVIDEVGQYVARNSERIEDLRVLVEALGKEGKNRLKAGTIPAPAWVVVTSQEKLDEVVAALDDRSIQLAKLQDRFHYRCDLSPADIREVATRRVLAKRAEAVPVLEALYDEYSGRMGAQCKLERSSIRCEVDRSSFVQFYPYLPHFIELSIKVVSGIRLQPGATRHLGGSNRTIIKQAYEMLVSDRTRLAEAAVGRLVSLDLVYELVEASLSSERQTMMNDIRRAAEGQDPDGFVLRTAKACCLLEFVREVPRTPRNLAAVLCRAVGEEPPIRQVEAALEWLSERRLVKQTEEGYKLLSADEKTWEDERQKYLRPSPGRRAELRRGLIEDALGSQARTYKWQNRRVFRPAFAVDGEAIGGNGEFAVEIALADDVASFKARLDSVQDTSRSREHGNSVFWVVALSPAIEDQIGQIAASQKMVDQYENVAAQNQLTPAERECLDMERTVLRAHRSGAAELVRQSLIDGTLVFRGQLFEGGEGSQSPPARLGRVLDRVIPALYQHIGLGAVPLTGREVDELLRAENLLRLPAVFHNGENGLGLIRSEGTTGVIDEGNVQLGMIRAYLHQRKDDGVRTTGKDLEAHFTGYGYAWDADLVRLLAAALLRGGLIEVTFAGRVLTSYLDPVAREVLTKPLQFRQAAFGERVAVVTLAQLRDAADLYASMTGNPAPELDEAQIAAAFTRLADSDYGDAIRLRGQIDRAGLPAADVVGEYEAVLETLRSAGPEEVVRFVVSEGGHLAHLRRDYLTLKHNLTPEALAQVARARRVLGRAAPALPGDARVDALQSMLAAGDLPARVPALATLAGELADAYAAVYAEAHAACARRIAAAQEGLQGVQDYDDLTPAERAEVERMLGPAACTGAKFDGDQLVCPDCKASPEALKARAAEVERRVPEAKARVQTLVLAHSATPVRTERLRLRPFFPDRIESIDEVDRVIDDLRAALHRAIDEGAVVLPE